VQAFDTLEAALQALQAATPHLVVLGPALSEGAGPELCARLQGPPGGEPAAVVLIQPAPCTAAARARAAQAGAAALLETPGPEGVLREQLALLAQLARHRRAQARAETELGAARAKLEEAQRLATLGTFARGIGHELNNVATVLKSGLEELARGGAPDPELVEELTAATAQLQGLSGAVQRLAAPSQSQVVLEVRTVVRDVVSLARLTGRTKYLSVALDLPPEPVYAALSLAEAQQLVLALLLDAADAVAALPGGKVRLVLEAAQGQVQLSVADNAGPRPTGAGLEPSRLLLEGWGGALEVTAAPDGGMLLQARFPSER
jgi:signal transduction histidine kinase